jgi:proliferating cell nuclear antigen
MQAMDSSHVSLCSVKLNAEGFDHYRCDKPINLGISFENLSKILKCAGNDDIINLAAQDESDTLEMTFESPNAERISDFQLKLMDIESDHLGIPETEYMCNVRMPATEFQRIIRDLTVIGDACNILMYFFPYKHCLTVPFLNRHYFCDQGGH